MGSNIQLHVFSNLNEFTEKAVDIFYDIHRDSKNRFYILPGGTTPQLFYNLLAKQVQDWSNTQLILSDERMTYNKKLSNTAMIKEIFIQKIKGSSVPEFLQYNLKGGQLSIEKILKFLTPELAVLGLGADGHTASLFPGNSRIFHENDAICINTNNDWEEFDRVSLTFNYLMKANQIVFLVSGEEKAKALKECLEGDFNPIQYPAQFIFQHYLNDIHVVCDHFSARNLA